MVLRPAQRDERERALLRALADYVGECGAEPRVVEMIVEGWRVTVETRKEGNSAGTWDAYSGRG